VAAAGERVEAVVEAEVVELDRESEVVRGA
jgi:hypothetical protein